MRLALKLHPDSQCATVTSLAAEVSRPAADVLRVGYRLSGAMSALRLPPLTSPTRADGLWRRTCFEAFIGAGDSGGYYELNFAPSTQWAAYRFNSYRAGMGSLEIGPPRIEVRSNADSFELDATLDLRAQTALPADAPWRLGLSAVIEDADGRLSYWALAHPPGKPDFHHADCLACEVVAPQQP